MLSLAWRNLWRQRRRSLVTAGAVAIVVALSLIYYSFGGASINSMYQNLTRNTGHVQIHVPNYRELRDFRSLLIRDAAQMRATVESVIDGIDGGVVVGVLDVPGLLAGEDRSRAVLLTGRDWPEPLRSRFLEENLAAGTFVAPDDVTGIVLGSALARSLEVDVGDEVLFYAPETEGFGAAAYTVIGLLDMLDINQERTTALVSLPAAQELAAPGAVNRFEIHFPDLRRVAEDTKSEQARSALAAALPEFTVETWRELDPTLPKLLDAIGPLMAVVTLIFFVLAGLLVVNTIYLSLMERIREFGVIISLGASGRKVLAMITLESLLLCVTGAVIGSVAGLAFIAYYADGLTIPGLDEYYASFGLDPVFFLSITPTQVLVTVSFALATGILSALWPAALAARLEPVEAMRFTA